MITVYVDVLIGLNWFVNFFLLMGVAKIGKIPARFYRNLLASFVLALGSLTIFLPPLSTVVETAMRLGFAGVGVVIAYGFPSFFVFLKNTGMFFAATFAFGGITLGLWYLFHPQNMVIHNGITYINLSPVTLIVFTLISYGILWLIRKNFAKESSFEPYATLHIQTKGKTVSMQAKVDTGFALEDLYTGNPVVLISSQLAEGMANEETKAYRLLPFETVNGAGLLKAKTVPNLVVEYQKKQVVFPAVTVAVGERKFNTFDALVGYDLIERMAQYYESTSNFVAKNHKTTIQKKNRLHQRLGSFATSLKTGGGTSTHGTAEKR